MFCCTTLRQRLVKRRVLSRAQFVGLMELSRPEQRNLQIGKLKTPIQRYKFQM